ncbi:hypothetical protein [Tranquillimonas alkanivorans]|uniref:Uncharacterized protein n=1 Tax=Tranquillimonas alkanivorans TaxID=441119 RepID=A0A1I5VLW9_9RHOB|nr:hypothetical protein [Tranquillimonas alkanivorans]SFQ08422.1 hypothetical protein SAMN04488047_1334 [Tranquillimonas alkanivorans]
MQAESDPQQDDLILAKQEGREALSAWAGWVMAPAAWALHQGIGYAMVPWLCALGTRWPYHALTVFAVGLCIGGALMSRKALRRSRHIRPEHSRMRVRMMALIGLMFSAAAFGGILVEYLPSFLIDTCNGVDR